jgi:hypothetical protein
LLEVDKGIGWPKPSLKFLSCYQLTGPFQEHCQDGHRLTLEPDSDPLFSEFSGPSLEFVDTKTVDP